MLNLRGTISKLRSENKQLSTALQRSRSHSGDGSDSNRDPDFETELVSGFNRLLCNVSKHKCRPELVSCFDKLLAIVIQQEGTLDYAQRDCAGNCQDFTSANSEMDFPAPKPYLDTLHAVMHLQAISALLL